MSVSGTATFSRNRNQLIGSALRKIGAFESGETPDNQAVLDASDALNAMIKHWQASGINIWSTEEAILFPVASQLRYTLGLTSTDRVAQGYVETSLASSSAGTSISVNSIVGISAGYIIGVLLDGGTMQWSTVNGAPSGNTVTLNDALGTASVGNAVFAYQSALVRPIRVIDARRYNLASKIDVPLAEMDRLEYQDMPNKTSTGAVNSYFYDRMENTTGILNLWPAPADASEAIKMTVARPIDDFNSPGDDADLPQEWVRAIEWGLADELADEYDVPDPKRSRIERRAAQYLSEVNFWERELVSFQLVPDYGK